MSGRPLLFTPLRIRGFEARNRVMISPMQQYAVGADGLAGDCHLAHIRRFALGGAGMVVMEATAIEPAGRNSWGDLSSGKSNRWPAGALRRSHRGLRSGAPAAYRSSPPKRKRHPALAG